MCIINISISYMLQNVPALFVSYETKLRLARLKRCTCHIKIRVMPMANFSGHVWDKREIRYLKMGSVLFKKINKINTSLYKGSILYRLCGKRCILPLDHAFW